ncbi:hypothetical protein HOA92_06370 [archaeon]|jgi:hypothetical protein|nr:hypothetical protein [archaeon]MBT6762636.1 hypothetical protein [archaeon]
MSIEDIPEIKNFNPHIPLQPHSIGIVTTSFGRKHIGTIYCKVKETNSKEGQWIIYMGSKLGKDGMSDPNNMDAYKLVKFNESNCQYERVPYQFE